MTELLYWNRKLRQLQGNVFKPYSEHSFPKTAWHICLQIFLFRDLKNSSYRQSNDYLWLKKKK